MTRVTKAILIITAMPITVFAARSMAAYNAAKPWGSKALSPVGMQFKKDMPPFIILSDGKAVCDIVIPSMGEKAAYYKEVAERMKYFLDDATGASFAILPDRSSRQANLAYSRILWDNGGILYTDNKKLFVRWIMKLNSISEKPYISAPTNL